jgi:hypothetical protein
VREAPVPSYRVRSAANEGSSTRMVAMAGGLAAVVAVGALVGWGITRLTTDRPIPTVEADARPVKIRPDDRGGLRVANQDEIIFERRNAGSAFDANGRLAPAAEAPNLDALRAATAPPPAIQPPRIITERQAPLPASEVPPVPAVPGQPTRPQAPPPPAPQAAGSPLTAPQAPAPQAPAPQAAAPQALTAPAAPVAPAPVAPARVAAGGSVVVQLGALDSESGARTEWDRLARRAPELLQGRTPQIIRFERQDRPTMWRLRTGGFSAEAAREFCDGVRGKGGACAVIGG